MNERMNEKSWSIKRFTLIYLFLLHIQPFNAIQMACVQLDDWCDKWTIISLLICYLELNMNIHDYILWV